MVVLGKKKEIKRLFLSYQEMALKEGLLVTAPRCSNLFSERTLAL